MSIQATKGESTSIKSSDSVVKSAPGDVFWIAVSATSTGGAFQLNDSTDDSGTDKFDITMPANTVVFFGPFDPPIRFTTGIYADIPGTNVTLTIGYQ